MVSDDNLVTDFRVETDFLLEPKGSLEPPNDVLLVIRAKAKIVDYEIAYMDMNFQ